MKPVEATIKEHDEERGQRGDCLRACIASLLELRAFEVPHFHDGRDNDEARAYKERWLAAHGLWECAVPFEAPDVDTALQSMGPYFPDQYWMLTAASSRGIGAGFDHVVVCRGDRIVHDPTYGDPHGIVGPASDGYWWASVLARICG